MIDVADDKKIPETGEEVCPTPLSREDSAILQAMIKRERERRIVKAWWVIIGRRAKEWALVYVAIGTAIVAGREQIAALLHWFGIGGPK